MSCRCGSEASFRPTRPAALRRAGARLAAIGRSALRAAAAIALAGGALIGLGSSGAATTLPESATPDPLEVRTADISSGAVSQPTSTTTASPMDTLRAAERAYEDGMRLLREDPAEARRRFEESARLYTSLRDAGADNASLHFNLGNAQLQSGRVGEAIASFLRAERLAPGDTQVQRNLAHARTQVADRFDSAGSTMLLDNVASWWHVVSIRSRLNLALAGWVLLWLLVVIRTLRPRILTNEGSQIAWRWGLAASLMVFIIAGGTVAADALLDRLRPRGVIVEHGVIVRKGNGEGFEPQFIESLGEGVEFRVRDRRPGWIEIELPNGRGGWIREGDASLI